MPQYREFHPRSASPACQSAMVVLSAPEIELPWVVAVGAEVELHVLELEHHVELTAGRAGEAGCLRDGHAGHLPDCEYVRVPACEHLPVHLPEELVIARPASEEAARK